MAKAYSGQFTAAQVLSSAFDTSTNTIAISGGGSSTVDGSTFTASSDAGSPVEGIYQSTPSAVADGKYGVARISASRAWKTDMDTALSKLIDSVTSRPEGTTFTNITASTSAIRTGAGILTGMYVNSTSSGTIKIYDSLTQANTVINNTITPAIGWHALGSTTFSTGLSVTVGGTLDVTLYYIPTP